ncbi:WD40 repeat domain-containing protein [Sporobolomyces salmoneus]|uniref:WD40 repeat domain-containing protein n=1 Tax=Sporobolomyces salmoneus TaxID=183962 RepID=UPI00317670C8
MTNTTTPTRFANDITNLPSTSSSSPVPSSSSSKPPKLSTRRTSYRQTSLADSFFRSSSPAPIVNASTPATSTVDAPIRSSSPCGRDLDGDLEMELAEQGLDYDEAENVDTRTNKRRRTATGSSEGEIGDEFVWHDADLVARFDARVGKGKQSMESIYNVPGTQLSAFRTIQRRELGFHSTGAQFSMRPYLRTLVSSNEDHVARIPSIQSYRDFSPPFALAFSHDAKSGGKQVVAVSDEEGTVSFLSGEKEEWYMGPNRDSFKAHANAIFDVAWSKDDQLIATASGDQTVRLHDVESKTCVGVLSGHTCTVKNVTWDPYNPQMLSTASRDGSIRVWDRRVRGYAFVEPQGSAIGTVNHIKNAHGKGKQSKARSATRSVTAVNYLLQQDNLLASAGSADSVIKVWDLRRSHSRRVNPAFYETNEEAVTTAATARPHGIASMQLAPDGKKLYALSTDSRIYAFDPLNLTHPAPLRTFIPPLPSLSAASFYVRCAISPDSRYLASGSADGELYLWDTEGNGTDAVRIKGHEKEVSGLDWTDNGLATCSDDYLVRKWHFDTPISRRRSNPNSNDSVEAMENRKLVDRWSGEVVDV